MISCKAVGMAPDDRREGEQVDYSSMPRFPPPLLSSASDTPLTDMNQTSLPRLIAVVLAVGGSVWGVLLLLSAGAAVLVWFPFCIGYPLTAGYIVRAVTCPSLVVRRVIWLASIVVQGGWLLYAGLQELPRVTLPFLWWAFATAASVIAIAYEREPISKLSAGCPADRSGSA